MKAVANPVTVRIEWCRRQSAQARTEPESDGWRAEADGLRDALMNADHTDNYQLCPPELLRRYVQGLEDGTALLRAARVCSASMPPPQISHGRLGWGKTLPGDDR